MPPIPSDTLNGSFHSPKPHVPDRESLEVRADRLRWKGRRRGKSLLLAIFV
jgi:hypothetical protein